MLLNILRGLRKRFVFLTKTILNQTNYKKYIYFFNYLLIKINFNNVFPIFLLAILFGYLGYIVYYSDISILYNWSENLFIRTVQKIIFGIFLVLIGVLVLNYLGIYLLDVIHCDSDSDNESDAVENNNNNLNYNKEENTKGKEKEIVEIHTTKDENSKEYYNFKAKLDKEAVERLGSKIIEGITQIAPIIGGRRGAVGSAIIKTTNQPALQRLGLAAAGVAISTTTYLIGLKTGAPLTKNLVLGQSIKESKHGKPNLDTIPSPEGSSFTANSPLEDVDLSIPLLDILDNILSLNVLELIIIILIILTISNKKIKKFILNNIKVKYIPVKYVKLHKILDSLLITNDRIDNIMVAIFVVFLIINKLLNIYFISELNTNIDDFILVYNQFKKS
jgi:hypothetical protein